MNYYLGLDGGGTKTAAVILDESGRERGRGQGGPCNIATCDDETLRHSVSTAAQGALSAAGLPTETRFAAVCAGVAGYTAKGRRSDFLRLLTEIIPAGCRRVEPDFVIAYWGATEGEPGIIVIAGTGSVVYGRNAQGETCRAGGRGFLLGDKGSGFYLGQAVLQGIARSLDAGQGLTALEQRIMAQIGAEDVDDLVEWVYRDFQPARIAGLGELIGRMADEGDRLALTHTSMAAFYLRSAVLEVRIRLDLPENTPVFPLGGLWKSADRFMKAFQDREYGDYRIPNQSPLNIHPSKYDAAYGAALLARQEEL